MKAQTLTTLEDIPDRIYGGHIATLQDEHRDEPEYIVRVFQSGELPVGAVATAAHGPDNEGARHPRPEQDGEESRALPESIRAYLG